VKKINIHSAPQRPLNILMLEYLKK